jgi:hypothetical protein
MPFGLAYRVSLTTRAELRRVACRNERLSRADLSRVTAGEARTLAARIIEHEVRAPAEPERRGTLGAEARACTCPPVRLTPRREPWRSTGWKLFTSTSCVAARSWLSASLPPPAKPCERPRCEHRSHVEHRFSGPIIDANLARVSPLSPGPRLRDRFPDSARRIPSPVGPVIALLSLSILSVGHTNTVGGCPPRCRLVSDNVCHHHRPARSSDARPGRLRSGLPAASPPWGRSPPTLPSWRSEYPRNVASAVSVSPRIAVRFGRVHPGISRDPVGALGLLRHTAGLSSTSADSRRRWRVATPAASRQRGHRATETWASKLTDSRSQRLSVTDRRHSRAAPTTSRRHQTVALRPQSRTRPIAQLVSDSMMSPSSALQKRRKKLWECAGIHHTLDAWSPGRPGSLTPRLAATVFPGKAGSDRSCSPPSML